MINGYEDINDNVKTQNGAWMTSWLSDHTEKLNRAIPDNDKDTVKISTWLLIVFLRYNCPKIHTERRNNNENKIRTNSIGDMLQCSISPNNMSVIYLIRVTLIYFNEAWQNLGLPWKQQASRCAFRDSATSWLRHIFWFFFLCAQISMLGVEIYEMKQWILVFYKIYMAL